MSSGSGPAPPLPPPAAGGRGNLLADIQKGGRLKKVSDSEKRDRSAAIPSGGAGGSGGGESAAPPSPAPGGGEGGLAGALASALAARKSKVSASGKFPQSVLMTLDLC